MPEDDDELRKKLQKSLGGEGVIGDPVPGFEEQQIRLGPQAVTRFGHIPIYFRDLNPDMKAVGKGKFEQGEYNYPGVPAISVDKSLRGETTPASTLRESMGNPPFPPIGRYLSDVIGHEQVHAFSPDWGTYEGIPAENLAGSYSPSVSERMGAHLPWATPISRRISEIGEIYKSIPAKERLASGLFGGHGAIRSPTVQDRMSKSAADYLMANPTPENRNILDLYKSHHYNVQTGKWEPN